MKSKIKYQNAKFQKALALQAENNDLITVSKLGEL
jgi:hypothetical protein